MFDVKSIKPQICTPKQYDVLLWRPRLGTGIINKFESRQMYNTYGAVVDLDRFRYDIQLLRAVDNGKVSVTTGERPFVIIGTCGEMWAPDRKSIIMKYSIKWNIAP